MASKKASKRLTVEDAQYKMEEAQSVLGGWIMSFDDARPMDKLPVGVSAAVEQLYEASEKLKKAAQRGVEYA